MLYQITQIKLDFTDDICPFCNRNCPNVHEDEACDEFVDNNQAVEHSCLKVWQADDDDDLIERVTSATGFCVLSVNYETVYR